MGVSASCVVSKFATLAKRTWLEVEKNTFYGKFRQILKISEEFWKIYEFYIFWTFSMIFMRSILFWEFSRNHKNVKDTRKWMKVLNILEKLYNIVYIFFNFARHKTSRAHKNWIQLLTMIHSLWVIINSLWIFCVADIIGLLYNSIVIDPETINHIRKFNITPTNEFAVSFIIYDPWFMIYNVFIK